MSAWVLAWRNLLRNRRRSLTTLLAILIGAGSILVFGGYSRYIVLGIQTEYVSRVGHLQIQHEGFYKYGAGNPEAFAITHYKQIIEKVKADPVLAPMLTMVTPTLQFGGIAGNQASGTSRMVLGTGVVADDSARLREWNDYGLTNPSADYYLSLAGSDENMAILGTGVARMLQLCTLLRAGDCAPQASQRPAGGDNAPDDIVALSGAEQQHAPARDDNQIEILASNAHGAPNVVRVHAGKAQDQGVKELDDVAIQLHLSKAQKLVYGKDEPGVTAIVIQLAHTDQIPLAQARLKELRSTVLKDEPIEVLDFATLNPLYGQSINMLGSIFGFVSILISVIVLFTVVNTMGMAIVERTVEIGTLRAMGLRGSGIQRIFVCEGALLGALGAVLGVSSALVVAFVINHSGLTYVPPGRAAPVPLKVWIWGSPFLMAGTVVGLMMTAVASAWLPARRAARMDIVSALRHV